MPPIEQKTDDVKESFYEKLDRVCDKFPKYHIKILLGDFNAKVGKENIFKLTIENKSMHEISNDNGVRSKVQCSHISASINILGCLQMENPQSD
jgi:hypothetical protein